MQGPSLGTAAGGRVPYLHVLSRVLGSLESRLDQEFQGLGKVVRVGVELNCHEALAPGASGSLQQIGWVQGNVGKASLTRRTGQSLVAVGPSWVSVSHGVPRQGVVHSRCPLPSGGHVGLLL